MPATGAAKPASPTARRDLPGGPQIPGRAPGPPTGRGGRPQAAAVLAPLLELLLGGPPQVRFRFWDGSTAGPQDSPGTVTVRSVDALRRILWAPGELGVARAFVAGDIEFDGDLYAILRVLHAAAPTNLRQLGWRSLPAAAQAARRLGVLRPPPPPPTIEARPRGRRHSPRRDAQAISHHYDVGNDFYEWVLGPSMTYSCARFPEASTSLEDAQVSKHELVCAKLGLPERPRARLLDVGCGWGSLALHAALHHQARVVGVTLSRSQVDYARERVRRAGLEETVEIRLQDYRELRGERFDAVASIGMFEHVGADRAAEYFAILRSLLTPTGRLLNHAISTPGGSTIGPRTFTGRYVFPDGELLDVGKLVLAMQRAGFEVRDVESLREHYSRTLHAWVANLQSHWAEAVASAGAARANVWRLYMSASANGFDDGGLAVHQVLGVVPDPDGHAAMPPTRAGWV